MDGKIQTLTLEYVKAAARKAYDEGRLVAQNFKAGDEFPSAMFLTPKGHCCAIGAALNDDTLELLKAGKNLSGTIYGLLARGQVRISPPGHGTADQITNIMIAHDLIIGDPLKREKRMSEFLRLIEHPSALSKVEGA